jgi:hypothetical protein
MLPMEPYISSPQRREEQMSGVKGKSGGVRKGAGRKPGSDRVKRHFALTKEAYRLLQTIPISKRSHVVSASIIKYLRSTSRKENA